MPSKTLIHPDDEQGLRFSATQWLAYRRAYPCRAHGEQLVFTQASKPYKDEQRAWHVYEQERNAFGGMRQQWVMVPTLLGAATPTEPLVGAPPEAALFTCMHFLSPHELLTNIYRIMFLAQKHPLIQSVRQHKTEKADHPSAFDDNWRATDFHQAPFDLAIVFAASGAEMHVGMTTNGVSGKDTVSQPGGLIALWWRATAACFPRQEALLAEAVLLDICELDHKIPDLPLGRVYRQMASGPQSAPASSAPRLLARLAGHVCGQATSATTPAAPITQPKAAEPQLPEGAPEGEPQPELQPTAAEPQLPEGAPEGETQPAEGDALRTLEGPSPHSPSEGDWSPLMAAGSWAEESQAAGPGPEAQEAPGAEPVVQAVLAAESRPDAGPPKKKTDPARSGSPARSKPRPPDPPADSASQAGSPQRKAAEEITPPLLRLRSRAPERLSSKRAASELQVIPEESPLPEFRATGGDGAELRQGRCAEKTLWDMSRRLSQQRLSTEDARHLPPWGRDMLVGVRRKDPVQQHFNHSQPWNEWNEWQVEPEHPQPRADGTARAKLFVDLVGHANPCPRPEEWFWGIHHKNVLQDAQPKWEPVRAIQSNKQVCLDQLVEEMTAAIGATELGGRLVRDRDGQATSAWVFMEAFPDTSPKGSGGVRPLRDADWHLLWDAFRVRTEADFVKHLLNMHDGEVRFVGEPTWSEVPCTIACGPNPRWGTCSLFHSRFWHPQTMKTDSARQWCLKHHGALQRDPEMKEVVLKPEEWQHLLQEEDNETLLLKHIPATSGKPARWFIRSGNYITLGELFVFGFHKCSCWDLYRTYTSLEVFVARKNHSVSNTENGIRRRNAKRLRKAWCGRWGLPQ